jgi:hypothetical protein
MIKAINDKISDIINHKATSCAGCDTKEIEESLEVLKRAFYGKGDIVYDAAKNAIKLDETDMFLSEEFIISASFEEFRKAAKDKCYLQTWNEVQADNRLGVTFY